MSEITVLIPAYNSAPYLTDAVRSFIGGKTSLGTVEEQTLKDFEVIIINDGSSDNTDAVCKNLVKEDLRVHYLTYSSNAGKPHALNIGLKTATGKFITVMDADDMRDSKSLEKLHEVIVKDTHSFVYDDMIIFGNGQKVKNWKFPEYDFEKSLTENHVHTGLMVSIDVFLKEKILYPEVMRDGREDWAFNVLLGSLGYCGKHVNYFGYLYRREGQNRTLNNVDDLSQQKFIIQMRTLFPELYAGRFPMGCCGGRGAINFGANDPVASSKIEMLVGSPGMSIVEYVGFNDGTETVYGPITGTKYVYGKSRPKLYVDNRDLRTNNMRGILDLYDHGRSLFRLAAVEPAPVEKEPVKVAEVVAEMVTDKGDEKQTAEVVSDIVRSDAPAEVTEATDILKEKLGTGGYYEAIVKAGLSYEDILSMSIQGLIDALGVSRPVARAIKNALVQ